MIHHHDNTVTVHHGDCLDILRTLPDNSIDAVVTDPPYGLANTTAAQVAETLTHWVSGDRTYIPQGAGFMGKAWDAFVPPAAVWDECYRVLKPGGHMLVFAGTRTHDLMTLGIRLAGFDIRDSLFWAYASGFPKSLNVNKNDQFCQCGAVPYTHDGDHSVHGVREAVPNASMLAQESEGADLLSPMQRRQKGPGVGEARTQGARGSQDENPNVWSCEPSVEGWGDIQEAEGQLHRGEVRSVPSGMAVDGAGGRVHLGTPPSDGSVGGPNVDSLGVREPRQSRPVGQSPGESRLVADERGSQAWRGWPICGGCGKPRLTPGLGTSMKPAQEPIVLARKPLAGTVANNVTTWGTGALNIDVTRVGTSGGGNACPGGDACKCVTSGVSYSPTKHPVRREGEFGRWPSNLVLTHAADCTDTCADGCPVAELDRQSGVTISTGGKGAKSGKLGYHGGGNGNVGTSAGGLGDTGSASRFFPVFRYQAKAPTRERVTHDGTAHPTVKPLDLMRWLARLVTPPGGTILEPFAGSGTTIEAAMLEGFHVIAVEREADYLPLIDQRITRARAQLDADADADAKVAAAPQQAGLFDDDEVA